MLPSSPHTDRGTPAAAPPGSQTRTLLLRAMGFGVGATVAVFAIAWLGGLLPAATSGYAALGAGAALLAGVLALVVHGRIVDARRHAFADDPRLMAGRLQGLLGAAFGLKLAALVLGMLYVNRLFPSDDGDAKFAATASFCIAFASASLVCQLVAAGYLARALGRRSTPPLGAATGGTPGRLAVGDPPR